MERPVELKASYISTFCQIRGKCSLGITASFLDRTFKVCAKFERFFSVTFVIYMLPGNPVYVKKLHFIHTLLMGKKCVKLRKMVYGIAFVGNFPSLRKKKCRQLSIPRKNSGGPSQPSVSATFLHVGKIKLSDKNAPYSNIFFLNVLNLSTYP